MWKSKKMLPRDEITHEREPDVTAFAAVTCCHKIAFFVGQKFSHFLAQQLVFYGLAAS